LQTTRILALPTAWFDRPQYAPRLARAGAGSPWFLLDPAFRPSLEVPHEPPPAPRAAPQDLLRAFEETYRAWGLARGPETERAFSEVAASAAVVVCGQQPGFLGGPLYTLYKALTAIAAATRYRAVTGRPCVPVFWAAAEDHDLDEAREARLPGPAGTELSFCYPGGADRRPLADYPIDAAALAVLDEARARLAPRPHGETAVRLLDLYRGRTLASGFAALLDALLGHAGLLVLDPAALRPLAAPIVRDVIAAPGAVLEAIEEGRRAVRGLGMAPRVAARFPLFVIRDGRRHHLAPVTTAGESAPGNDERDTLFRAGNGETFSRAEILALLDRDPRAFSSGVLLRPLVQEALLPCVLTIGGPAEVAYFAQLPPLARLLGVTPPPIALRLTATLFEGKGAATAARLDLEVAARAAVPEDLLTALGPSGREGGGPTAEISRLAALAEKAALSALEGLPRAGKVPRLERRAAEARDLFTRLEKDITRAREGEDEEALQAARRLWGFAFPAGVLQERRWNVLHFVARHGTRWLDEVLEELEKDPLRIAHRWILFEPAGPARTP
jgi:bacillithiol biosynthesis cysteine-adding enzyme BshC